MTAYLVPVLILAVVALTRQAAVNAQARPDAPVYARYLFAIAGLLVVATLIHGAAVFVIASALIFVAAVGLAVQAHRPARVR